MNASENFSQARVAYVLARVNSGLATEWSQIDQLAASLRQMLQDAHAFGHAHIPADRQSDWDAAWQGARTIFENIRSLDAEAQKRFTADEPSSDPLEPFSDILERENEFTERLKTIRKIADNSVPAGERPASDDLYKAIQIQIAILNAHALAVRFQLELRRKYGAQKAGALAKKISDLLPKDASIADAQNYAAEYQEAWQEFEHEKETFGGVSDVLKALMMIQPKTPEERVRDRHPQRLQQPHL